MSATANYKCPSAKCSGHLEATAADSTLYECQDCGDTVHEAVAELADDLADCADRDDGVGDLADVLLETGGIQE